jgi:hypothetical protein
MKSTAHLLLLFRSDFGWDRWLRAIFEPLPLGWTLAMLNDESKKKTVEEENNRRRKQKSKLILKPDQTQVILGPHSRSISTR